LQEGLLFHGLYDGGAAYAEQLSCVLEGLDLSAFKSAWQHLFERHTIMRSSFHHDAFALAVQCVYKKVDLPLHLLDVRHADKATQQEAIAAYQAQDQARGLDFRQAPLMRITLFQTGEKEYTMLWTYHHLIFDGWSMPLLMQEFLQAYDRLVVGEPLPPLAEDRFEDYIRYIEGKGKEAPRQFWKDYLQGVSQATRLPFVSGRSKAVAAYREVVLELSSADAARLTAYARAHHLTVNTVMQGVWARLLHGYTGQGDIVYGVTVSGRPEDLAGVESRVGIYTNTIALRSTLPAGGPVSDWLQALQQGQLVARDHQYSSLSEVQQLCEAGGELFDTMLTFQNYPVSEVVSERQWQLKVRDIRVHEQTTNYPLSLRITIGPGVKVEFIYKESEIGREEVERIRGHFREVLLQISVEGAEVQGLDLVPAEEKRKLLEEFNRTAAECKGAGTVVELFRAQAAGNGGALAIVAGEEELSYRELDERSEKLAAYLRSRGVGADVLVPVCLGRSAAMIVSILGVLKAGGAYVPIDPAYPQERIAFMLKDTQAQIVLTDTASSAVLPATVQSVCVDDSDQWDEMPSNTPDTECTPDQLAYVIYTSGSTGNPKGVMITHRSLGSYLSNAASCYIGAGHGTFLHLPFSFDASLTSIFLPLISGARIVLASKSGIEVFSDSLFTRYAPYDFIKLTPSHLPLLQDAMEAWDEPIVSTLVVGGEALQPAHFRFMTENTMDVTIVNEYGPTEATVGCCVYSFNTSKDECRVTENGVLIGKPWDHVSLYILDQYGKLAPAGVYGELCIGGMQVAKGYFNQPALSAEKFIANPYIKGEKIYKTGDVCRWLADGNIDYQGRTDDQVKIRGYRIELSEVEAALSQAPGILRAAVVVNTDVDGNKRLAGYVVTAGAFNRDNVITWLRGKLPDHMVPSLLAEVESLPLTSNGKVDRKRLQEMDPDVISSGMEYEAPSGAVELALAAIWQDLLEVELVGRKDDFFSLGGHSLLAIRLISSIKKELNKELSIKDIFDHATIEAQALLLSETGDNDVDVVIEKAEREELVPLSFSQEQLWFVDRLQGTVEYHMPYVFRLQGELNPAALEQALRAVITRHEALRTVIVEKDGVGFQHIQPVDRWQWQYSDAQDVIGKDGSVQAYIEEVCAAPFDLAKDNVFRVVLLKQQEHDHILIAVVHHIAFDGWSMSVMVEELAEFYRSYVAQRAPQLKELPVQYADYAIWQRKNLSGLKMNAKLNYWKEQLKGITTLKLLTDYPRPQQLSINGGSVGRNLDKQLLQGLQQLCQQENVTLFMTLLSAFNVLLYKYSGQSDMCIGSPIAGRQQKELEGLIGFFVNTLVLRSDVNGEQSFKALLHQVRQTTLDAYEHQQVPFEQVIKSLTLERDISRHPAFDVRFQLQNVPEAGSLDIGNVRLSAESPGEITALSDLSFDVKESEGLLALRMIYCSDLFKRETIERMLEHYEQLLRSIVADCDLPVNQLKMLSAKEEKLFLEQAGVSSLNYPKGKTIVSLFFRQAENTPEATAIAFGGTSLTYKELDARSNQLAHYLRAKGVRNEEPVVMAAERSLETIIQLLGILKAGAAYVPVDVQYPDERIAYILADTGCRICLGDEALENRMRTAIPDNTITFIDTQAQAAVIAAASGGSINFSDTQQLSYITYTSGATGDPLGVLIEHAHLTDSVHGMIRQAGLKNCSSFALFASLVEDAGQPLLFAALATGGAAHVLPSALIDDGKALSGYLAGEGIDCIKLAPSQWLSYVNEHSMPLPGKAILFSGETLPTHVIGLVKETGYTGAIYNLYGPAETLGKCIYQVQPAKHYQRIPIGRPFSNTRVYILDAAGQPSAIGVAGELYIGGDFIARGYLGQPPLTKEKFIEDPFRQGSRMYRTGDTCRWLPDNTIEYLDRNDGQVKIKGHRVELGEIENALNHLPEITSSCVVVTTDEHSSNRLAGYYIPSHDVLKAKEKQLYLKIVSNWKELYETVNNTKEENDAADSEFNILGWDDSFTGQPIPAKEIREWLTDITNVILAGEPQHVLEIGCGKGLIFYQLAGRVKKYIGTDFSSSGISQIKATIQKGARDYGEVELKVCAAHEVKLEEKIDTIVLNSVVQYFPGEDYLTGVLSNSIAMLNGKGRIVIGDVRDLRHLHNFRRRLSIERLQEGLSIREFLWQVEQEVQNEEELCFSPGYFYNLQNVFPDITHVEIVWKNGDFVNELSLYRFTVVLYVGMEKEMVQPRWQQWDEITDKQAIILQLENGAGMIALKDVPNPRLWKEQIMDESIVNRSVNTIRELSAAINTPVAGHEEIRSILETARVQRYDCRLLLDEDPMKMNLLIGRSLDTVFIPSVYSDKHAAEGAVTTNVPLFSDIVSLLHNDIRKGLMKRLPAYMVPDDFIALQHLPVSVQGKPDRAFLASRKDRQVSGTTHFQAPVTPLEQQLAAIWQDLLRLKKVGLHDNFFYIGGHSLLATRVVSAIRKELRVEVSIKDLFVHTTIQTLANHVQKQRGTGSAMGIAVQQKNEHVPLSFAQERLWFIDKLQGSVQYNMPFVFRLKGELNKEHLQSSFLRILQRHEVLRTVITEENGVVAQVVRPFGQWQFGFIDGSDMDAEQVQERIRQLVTTPFDLSNDTMLKVWLIECSPKENILVAVVHHIASDGWSTGILVEELVELYRSYTDGREPVLPALPIQYADYAIWQRNYLSGETLDTKLAYWKSQLKDVPPLQLPSDYARPVVQSIKGGVVSKRIGKDVMQALNKFTQEQAVTPFMALLSVFNVLLQRYSGQSDICVGSPVAGRQQQEVEGLIGFFINTLALRTQIDDRASFTQLVQQLKKTTLDAYEHQDIPFEKIVGSLGVVRDMSRSPLFPVVFTLQNTPEPVSLDLHGITLARESSGYIAAQFDFGIDITESEEGLQFTIIYCSDLYKRATMERMLEHYENLLRSALSNQDAAIAGLSMLNEREEKKLLLSFNDTYSEYASNKTVIDLFEEQVRLSPKAVALVFEEEEWSYERLDEQSTRLANYLLSKGVKEETLVPVCINRSANLIISIIAILKAGGAYVPVDPTYPASRISYMLNDIGSTFMLTEPSIELSPEILNSCERIDIDEELLAAQSKKRIRVCVKPTLLAYILYTSGSTGVPKGVQIEHRNVVSLVKGVKFVDLTSKDVILSTGSPSFDATTIEYWGALLNGGMLVMCAEHVLLDTVLLKQEIEKRGVTIMWFTAGWFNELVEIDISLFSTLKTILVGGDRLSPVHIEQTAKKYPALKIVNGYGPTENTTFSLTYPITNLESGKDIPVGYPLSNRKAYILDEQSRLCPVGIVGEICVGGDGLARGYLHQPELTAEKFIDDPFERGGRLYRTGDFGKWMEDGVIEYLGRKDEQAKIRGYRIEPGEIENVLEEAPGIQQAVVLIQKDGQGISRIIAYAVTEEPFDNKEVSLYLKDRLPGYMLPAAIVSVDAMPLTSNGKVDKKKLQEIEISDIISNEYTAPSNETEERMTAIWMDLLELERIGIHDNFFEIGGHSLLAVRLVSAIRKEMNVEINFKTFFELPTIALLCRYVKVNQQNDTDDSGQYESIKL
jgi:amino acid adenylation domain-containing protein